MGRPFDDEDEIELDEDEQYAKETSYLGDDEEEDEDSFDEDAIDPFAEDQEPFFDEDDNYLV